MHGNAPKGRLPGDIDRPAGERPVRQTAYWNSAYANDAEAKDVIGPHERASHIKSYDAVGYSRGSIILSRLMVAR